MAALISRAAFARYVGVTAAAITIACKQGRIKPEPNGKINPDSPTAHAFAEFHRHASKAIGDRGRGRPVAHGADDPVPPSILQETAAGRMPIPPATDIAGQGKALDNRMKAVDLARKKLKYMEQIKSVIPVDIIAMTIGRISAMLDENFRSFDERNSDELFDLARNSDKRTFAAALGNRIDESMKAVIDGVKLDVEKLTREE